MEQQAKEFFEKFKNDVAKMKQQTPETVSGFAALFGKVMQEGALSVREKELIALGIGVAPLRTLHQGTRSEESGRRGNQAADSGSRFGGRNDGWRTRVHPYSRGDGYTRGTTRLSTTQPG